MSMLFRSLGIVLILLIALPFSMALPSEKVGKTSVERTTFPLTGGMCDGAYSQLQSEATTAFGFNPGPVNGVFEFRVKVLDSIEIPFGIITKFNNTFFAYGKQIPLWNFLKWGILVLRTEGDIIKINGFVVPIGGTIADEQLITGHFTPVTYMEDGSFIGDWHLSNPATGIEWDGPFTFYPGQTWDCNAGQ